MFKYFKKNLYKQNNNFMGTINILYILIILLILFSEAVLKMKKFKDITIKEIEKPIKSWMAQASSRIKKLVEKNN